MKYMLIAALLLFAGASYAQSMKVTSYPPRYSGVLFTYSGTPLKYAWATSGVIAGLASSGRLITVDNQNGVDTLYFAIGTADTSAAKKFRVYPGQITNEWWSFANDVALFWRVPSDSTKQIKIIVR